MEGDFYIGWQERAPRKHAQTIGWAVALLLLLTLFGGLFLAGFQRTIAGGVFEWGKTREFSGTFVADPQPRLLLSRPGIVGTNVSYSSYLLVKPFKFGLDPQLVARLKGKSISVRGTLIYRDQQVMLEIREESLHAANSPTQEPSPEITLGRHTLRGEIVDSKCYLGVMNPGEFRPHRGCAIRCISGGIPPLLVVRQPNGPNTQFLLTARDGEPAGGRILEYIAEPVEVTGEVERSGDLFILRADLSTLHRI